jgi:hypothetical protein
MNGTRAAVTDFLRTSLSRLPIVLAVCSLLGLLGTSYVAVGLPVFATHAYVDERLVPIKVTLRDVKVLIISNSLDQLDTRKGILRSERLAIEQALTQRIDLASRQTFNNRVGQIGDELLAIERRKDELAKRTDELEKTP